MATKLNQLLAVASGARTAGARALMEATQAVQRPGLLSGISRTYQPKDDDGETLPPESTRVQHTAGASIADVRAALARLFDVTATVERTNTLASADIVVAGPAGPVTLAAGMPVTYLLFLERQLAELRSFVARLPLLDPADEWIWSPAAGYWAAAPVQTMRSKKVPRNHVLHPATDKHPAQVQMYTEDVAVGTWTMIKFSGAVPATERQAMLDRLDTLVDAVRTAREQANMTDVDDVRPGAALLGWVFDGV